MTLYNILKWILLAGEAGIIIYFLLVVRKLHKATNEFEDIVEEAKAEQEREKVDLQTIIPEDPEETPTMEIAIRRDGKDFVSFDVHPFSDKDFALASEYAQSDTGFDTDKYNAMLIYRATIGEHRKRIWEDPEFLYPKGGEAMTPIVAIAKFLTSGEMAAVVEAITKFTEDVESAK